MTTIIVRPADIRAIIDATYPDYKGPHARVEVRATAEYHDYQLNWSGGSITYLKALRVAAPDEALKVLTNLGAFQVIDLRTVWGSGQGYKGVIPADVMLVEHVISCGKDLGVRCIVSPDSQFMPRLSLPAMVELSRDEIIVLSAHKQLKGGHYRDEAYARAAEGVHYGLAPRPPKAFSDRTVAQVVEDLAARGLLKVAKNGASQITVEGRNALESLPTDRKVML
jgi:hypothetical protein